MAKGDRLDSEGEELFRNVHPNLTDNGQSTSAAFRPTPKDEGKLSVDRGSKCSAQQAYELHLSKTDRNGVNLQSVGVYAVSVAECHHVELKCYDDPIEADDLEDANPYHAVVDFESASGSKTEKIGKLLKKALARGLLHPTN